MLRRNSRFAIDHCGNPFNLRKGMGMCLFKVFAKVVPGIVYANVSDWTIRRADDLPLWQIKATSRPNFAQRVSPSH
jgi:hypothetical protein